jgi:hypothetical protein
MIRVALLASSFTLASYHSSVFPKYARSISTKAALSEMNWHGIFFRVALSVIARGDPNADPASGTRTFRPEFGRRTHSTVSHPKVPTIDPRLEFENRLFFSRTTTVETSILVHTVMVAAFQTEMRTNYHTGRVYSLPRNLCGSEDADLSHVFVRVLETLVLLDFHGQDWSRARGNVTWCAWRLNTTHGSISMAKLHEVCYRTCSLWDSE